MPRKRKHIQHITTMPITTLLAKHKHLTLSER